MDHLFARAWPRRRRGCPRSHRPRFEVLEDRWVPSTVTNLMDSGAGSLRDAIASTPPGGTVDFQPGLNGTITLTTGELAIAKNLTIAGPGADVITVSGNHASRVFDIAAAFTVDISGLTITNGSVANDNGGGILNAGTLSLTGCVVSGNTGAYVGGGLSNSQTGVATIIDSAINGNSAQYGGGIDNEGTLTVTDSTVSSNQVQFSGGGIIDVGPLSISDSTISDNTSSSPMFAAGGGLFLSGISSSAVVVANCTITGNSVNDTGGGIAFALNSGTLELTNSTISGNRAAHGGGGVEVDRGLLITVTNSTITNNYAGGDGGGIDNSADPQFTTTLRVADSTISGNYASGNGGGIYNTSATAGTTLTVTSSTITGNTARTGAGIATGVNTVSTVGNTIVASNTALSSSPDVSGPLDSQGHNLIGDGTGGSGYAPTDLVGTAGNPIDPKLGPLQDNGGPTLTMAALPSSPAIAAGDPTGAPPTDQRGLPRVLDGAIDIGAVELRVFHVTSTADAGPGSLRQAILDANATPGTNGIAFMVGAGGAQTIAPTSALPAVTNPAEIDGATQPDYAGAPLIALAGESAGPGADGLTLASNYSTITGLIVGGFGGAGVSISGDGNRVVGNFLGTDATGTLAHPNGTGVAVVYLGSNNTIGGTEPGTGNLISGNLRDGVAMYGGGGNTILGNLIGTDVSATQALPNGYGVELFSSSSNTVGGGSAAGAGNVISGNLYDGVGIYSDGNTVQGNRIGTDGSGTKPLGNGRDGVAILAFQYGSNNLIGGTDPGAGNTIAFNGGYGVRITTGTGEALHENAIFANAHGGIALLGGGNQDEPAPQLTSAISESGTTTISGTVTGNPGQVLTVEFFDNPIPSRQGEVFLGSLPVMVGASGQGNFQFQVGGGVNVGDFVTATATDPAGNTSPFSKPQQVSGAGAPDGGLNTAAVLPELATATSAGANAVTDAAAIPAPLPRDGSIRQAPAPPIPLAMVSQTLDAVFAGWDTATDGLALND